MNRRNFLRGMTGILATQVAPWVSTAAGVLMPVRHVIALDSRPIWVRVTIDTETGEQSFYYAEIRSSIDGPVIATLDDRAIAWTPYPTCGGMPA